MNENLNEIQTLKPFTKILMTIGELPTSYLMTMSYYEQMVWLCNYIGKNVIPALNNNAEATRELQLKYIELKNYVETYFDNLDIQEEINNKLDEMAESGELTDIIAQYLQLAGILAFNTLNDLSNAENLVNGSFTKIYGKLIYNDGYGAFYKIRTLINTDVIDGDNLVALTNYPTLVAEKMPDATINSILDSISDIEDDIEDINSYINYELQYNRVQNHFRFYIDGTNGDDSNDGLTQETAFKTLDRFLYEGNKRSNIACYIVGAGTYDISSDISVINGCTIHIKSNLANMTDVTINPLSSIGLVFYNCHINFENLVINNIDHIENTAGTLQNCYLTSPVSLYGGYHYFSNCKVNRILGYGACGYISSMTIDSKAKGRSGLEFTRGCRFDIAGLTYEVPEEKDTNLYFIYSLGSEVSMRGSITYNKQNDPEIDYDGLFLNSTILMIDNTLYNNLIANYTFQKARSLINHGDIVLPS